MQMSQFLHNYILCRRSYCAEHTHIAYVQSHVPAEHTTIILMYGIMQTIVVLNYGQTNHLA